MRILEFIRELGPLVWVDGPLLAVVAVGAWLVRTSIAHHRKGRRAWILLLVGGVAVLFASCSLVYWITVLVVATTLDQM